MAGSSRLATRVGLAPPNNSLQRTHRQSLRSFLFAAELDIVRQPNDSSDTAHEVSAFSGRLRPTVIERIDSLSLASGALLVAAVSAFLALFFAWLRRPVLRWAAAIGAPALVSYSLYWTPVWFAPPNRDMSEYSTWAFVCIPPWFLSGALASAAAVVSVRYVLGVMRRRAA